MGEEVKIEHWWVITVPHRQRVLQVGRTGRGLKVKQVVRKADELELPIA